MAMPFVPPVNYARVKENRPHRFAYDYGSVDPGMFAPTPETNRPKRAPKRSIAYTIPLPDEPRANAVPGADEQPQGHVLGVNALALSFQGPDAVNGSAGTGGVLFSGGRDGVVKAWDLNFPLKQHSSHSSAAGDGAADESGWAIDRHKVKNKRPRTTLRTSRVVHSDWVNDLLVVNSGATVVSASSDQTVRAWSPYRVDERPQAVGSHLDYVKALAYSAHRQMVVSGGLDRKIKLWDIGQGRKGSGPIFALQEFGDASVSSSVYTLACNYQGSLVVSGSPEKPIRVWDTRAGRQVTTLSGHTDHIRAVLLSQDSELVLSGSSDTTVKLWSMRMRRCLSTFAQHNDSVWSLYSSHPRFQTFYSASRDGLVAKTMGAGVFSDDAVAPASSGGASNRRTSLTPMSRNEEAANSGVVCVAVAKEAQGVVKLVAADDAYIWTATKGTKLNRWLDVSLRGHHHHHQGSRSRGISLGNAPMSLQQPVPAFAANSAKTAQTTGDGVRGKNSKGSTSKQDGRAGADSSESDSESDSDSDAAGEVTQRSLIEHWQTFSPKTAESSVGQQQQQQNAGNRHRRNHTVGHADINRPRSSHGASGAQTAVSPVLKAIQAEQARRSALRESDTEDQFYDAQSRDSAESPVSVGSLRFSHNRSQSAGGSTGQQQQVPLGSISSVLARDPHPSSTLPISIPGNSKAEMLRHEAAQQQLSLAGDLDALSIPDSPLPVASLMKADAPPTAGSPLVVQQKVSTASAAAGVGYSGGEDEVVPVRAKPDETIYGKHGLHRHKILDNKRQVLAQDTRGRVSLWDLMLCRRVYEFPESEEAAKRSPIYPGVHGKDFEAIQMAISTEPESVNSWCHVDTRVGALTVHLDESKVWNAEVHVDEVEGVTEDTIRAMGDHERVNIGQWMLKRLFLTYARYRVKRGPLAQRDATQLNHWVTQIPAGAVVSAKPPQQQQQKVLPEPPKSAPPTTATSRNPSMQVTKVLPPLSAASTASATATNTPLTARNVVGAEADGADAETQQPPRRVPSITSQLLSSTKQVGIDPPGTTGAAPANLAPTPTTIRRSVSYEVDNEDENEDGDEEESKTAAESQTGDAPHAPRMARLFSQPTYLAGSGHHHNPSIDTAANATPPSCQPIGQQQQQQQQQQHGKGDDSESAASNGSSGKFMSRLRSMRVRRQKSTPATQPPAPATAVAAPVSGPQPASNSNSGNGMLNAPGWVNGRSTSTPGSATNETSSVNSAATAQQQQQQQQQQVAKDEFAEWAGPRYPTETERTLALLQLPFAQWEQLYSPIICPRLPLPRNVVIQLCQEFFEASEPYSIYRNTIEAMAHPTHNDGSLSIFRVTDDPLLSLELCMPSWLTDFLLFNKLPATYQEPAKISFILSPSSNTTLAPFPNPSARLVANRMLRARKLGIYVVDKLGLPLMTQPAPNYINAVDVCVRAYTAMVKSQKLERKARSGNALVDLLTDAGEKLEQAERQALEDLVAWQEIRRRRAEVGDEEDAKEQEPVYVGRPELYLDLTCKEQSVAPAYTLATIKAHLWKSSSDVQVNYAWAGFVKRRVVKAQSLAAQAQGATL
ncbi:hypothetical protein GQ54DRAFT_307477 [Martensiomyces pterosporus]|nr:hypothetical protein GQ54DRAFT_307477 [Martensiomyces pterosporus]